MRKSPQGDRSVDRQREHQANERTFLAWLRTSIALIGFGFAISRFGLFLSQLRFEITQQPMPPRGFFNSETLGMGLVLFGIGTIALAAWRYNQVFWQIERNDYRPSRWAVFAMTVVVVVLGLLSIPILLVRQDPIAPNRQPEELGDRPTVTIYSRLRSLLKQPSSHR